MGINFRYSVKYLATTISLAMVLIGIYGCSAGGGFDSQSQNSGSSESLVFEDAFVARVIDGDTVELESGDRVRYLGIDTPETVHPDKPVECYGPESSDRNRQLVEGKAVRLLRNGQDRDSYDRLLRYVFVEDIFVNGDLVSGGYAYARSYGGSSLLYQTLIQLEKGANDSKRGLWAECY